MDEQDRHSQDENLEWLASLRGAGLPSSDSPEVAPEVAVSAPRLERDRPERRPLVPKGVLYGLVGFVVAVAAIAAALAWADARSQIAVPTVAGMDVGVARTALSRVGLELSVTERRFSASPEGTILSQRPAAGSMAERGGIVTVIVSAGTEELPMPDVIGDGIVLATGVLEDLGLRVEVEQVLSEAASDTVLSSVPAAGATVRSGDTVRLQVAAPRGSAVDVKPFKLDGLTFVIDPAPVPSGVEVDPVIEVARRLEAMLSASGARAVVLRSSFESATTDAVRAKRALEASPTVSIGLSLATGVTPGRTVSVPPSQTAGYSAEARRLAEEIVSGLSAASPPVVRALSSHDPVLGRTGAPWVRVILGSSGARDDLTLYSDPNWADRVARALYAAIGGAYGEAVLP